MAASSVAPAACSGHTLLLGLPGVRVRGLSAAQLCSCSCCDLKAGLVPGWQVARGELLCACEGRPPSCCRVASVLLCRIAEAAVVAHSCLAHARVCGWGIAVARRGKCWIALEPCVESLAVLAAKVLFGCFVWSRRHGPRKQCPFSSGAVESRQGQAALADVCPRGGLSLMYRRLLSSSVLIGAAHTHLPTACCDTCHACAPVPRCRQPPVLGCCAPPFPFHPLFALSGAAHARARLWAQALRASGSCGRYRAF
jgi:hypothetical protein